MQFQYKICCITYLFISLLHKVSYNGYNISLNVQVTSILLYLQKILTLLNPLKFECMIFDVKHLLCLTAKLEVLLEVENDKGQR